MEEMDKLLTKNHLRLETIKDILTIGQYCPDAICNDFAKIAVEDSVEHKINEKTLARWKKSDYVWQNVAYVMQEGIEEIDTETFCELFDSKVYAPLIIEKAKNLHLNLIDELLMHLEPKISLAAAKWCEGKNIPEEKIEEWRNLDCLAARIAAIYATIGKELPFDHPADSEWPFRIMNDPVGAEAIYKSFKNYDFPWCNAVLDQWYDHSHDTCKKAGPLLMRIAGARRGNVALIKKGLGSWDWNTQLEASKALSGKKLSLNTITYYYCSNRFTLRTAAMYASAGRADVPREWIERNFTARGDIAIGARYAAHVSGFPPYRTVEPSDVVYKQCLNNVIVVAEIPKDAEIRGRKVDGRYRSNKAKIVDIIGDFYGDDIGISAYDKKTKYRVGDVIEVPDFDFSAETHAAGFHFCLTKEKAISNKW
jgi:hypothetical protein